ncbi:hypothetical protein C9374_002402 [Naegleria lovaniensis]|uniref:Uncharacterized protein n=1 Tax=Naegleria lovaniensis TaxID=51637 RepID=A0AA88GUQ0_NAELO|nr:uncharacterized protein C9374_002402 [Naegleria lovaniensis]KAG2386658.1 hypothetical protein C9374_002402 [Naegleria lovaniensis]
MVNTTTSGAVSTFTNSEDDRLAMRSKSRISHTQREVAWNEHAGGNLSNTTTSSVQPESPISESYTSVLFSSSKLMNEDQQQQNLPPLSRILDRLWNSSVVFKVGFLLAVVIVQIVFYQLYIKNTLSNPSIEYKRKSFYRHLTKDTLTQEMLLNSPSRYFVFGNAEKRHKDYDIAKCVIESLMKQFKLTTLEAKYFTSYNDFSNGVRELKDKFGSNSLMRSLWNEKHVSPYIVVENNSNYIEIGSMDKVCKTL